MKKIVLMPVKNEAWILRESLSNFSSFADHIIIADQSSTDGSREIFKEFSKVVTIDNPAKGHSNTVRWLLLDTVRKLFPTEKKMIICLDADEMISKETVKIIEDLTNDHLKNRPNSTLSFSLPWIQLWKDAEHYRSDGVWANNYKNIIFIDDPKLDYVRDFTINDHTARIPKTDEIIVLPEHPILHFQYVSFEASQLKQAWYRASELIQDKKGARRINHKYSVSRPDGAIIKMPPKEWLDSIPEARSVKEPFKKSSTHLEDLENWFNLYGMTFFESLDIWHIDELKKRFVEKLGRIPKPIFYPAILVWINKFKNQIKKWL